MRPTATGGNLASREQGMPEAGGPKINGVQAQMSRYLLFSVCTKFKKYRAFAT